MAKGPKIAPIVAQNRVLAPLFSAICQRRTAHDMHKMERIIAPVMMLILLLIQFVFFFYYPLTTPLTVHIPVWGRDNPETCPAMISGPNNRSDIHQYTRFQVSQLTFLPVPPDLHEGVDRKSDAWSNDIWL